MNRTLAFVLAAALATTAGPAAFAQAPSAAPAGSKTLDMRDDASAWISDPHVHAFYQATVEAFAHGPDHLDRAAYQKRFREIFTDMAVAHHIPPEKLLDHLKRIPGEMVLIAKNDPEAFTSYDNFVVALFGPQPSGPGAAPG